MARIDVPRFDTESTYGTYVADSLKPAQQITYEVLHVDQGRFTSERKPFKELERSNMSRKEIVANRLKKLEEEYEKLNKWGDDNFTNGTVLKFKVKYAEDGKWYTFVALKVIDNWYLSLTSQNVGYSWDEFVEWLADKYDVKGLKVATDWEAL